MSIDSKTILFGYFDEEFHLNKIETPREKYEFIRFFMRAGCVNLSGRKLCKMPFEFVNFVPDKITALILDRNKFKNFSFLEHFPQLKMLTLNRNENPNVETFPKMNHLTMLSMNGCNIQNLHKGLKRIKKRCPELEYLSIRSSFFDSDRMRISEATNRRRTILTMFPDLKFLDNIEVTKSERQNAEKYKAAMRKKGPCCVL